MAMKDFDRLKEIIRRKAMELAEEIMEEIAMSLSSTKVKPSRALDKAEILAELFSALSSPGRIRLLLSLDRAPRRFSELEILSGLRGGSLKAALDKLLSLGLIERESTLYRLTPKGALVVRRIKEVSEYVRNFDYRVGSSFLFNL